MAKKSKAIIPITTKPQTNTEDAVALVKKTDATKFANILGLHCFEEVKEKILMGHTVEEVRRFIQEDRHELCEFNKSQIELNLLRFRNSLPVQDFINAPPMRIREAIATMTRGSDELEELDKLYLLQLFRINIDVATEERINKLFSTTNAEIRLAADILGKKAAIKAAMGDKLTNTPELTTTLQYTTTTEGDKITEERRIQIGMLAKKMVDYVGNLPIKEEVDSNIIDEDGGKTNAE